jgi:hypothetical protein
VQDHKFKPQHYKNEKRKAVPSWKEDGSLRCPPLPLLGLRTCGIREHYLDTK